MNRSDAFSSNNPPAGGPGAPPPSGVPDSRWAPVFQHVSEAPPARVWSGIERQLDLDDEDGVLPLPLYTASRSAVFGRWVAGVAAALLLAFLGWWSLRPEANRSLINSTIAAKIQSAPVGKGDETMPTPMTSAARMEGYASGKTSRSRLTQTGPLGTVPQGAAPTSPDAVGRVVVTHAAGSSPVLNEAEDEVSETISVQVSVQQTTRSATATELAVRPPGLTRTVSERPVLTTETQLAFSQTTRHSFTQSGSRLAFSSTTMPIETVVAAAAVKSMPTVQIDEPMDDRLSVTASPMAIRPFSMRRTGNDRIVWFSPERPDLEPKQKTARKTRQKAWVSAGMVASSFDPSVALRAVSGLAYTNNSLALTSVGNGPVPALALDSRAGRAIAVQASVGVPLSEHWTIETGLGLLNGQSTVQSPVRTSALPTEKLAALSNAPTLYTDLLGNSANRSVSNAADIQYGNATQHYAFVASTSYDRAVSQSVSNNYQFVQAPVQLSYELRPRRKFGLALITGMVANLFVRNTVAEAVTVKAQDGVYRPFTVAGTAGMRLRFRPDKHWSTSLAGTLQQSLQSITRPEVGIQSLPQNIGVCFSVDRHF